MVWTLETSNGFESRKCRNRIVEHLHGLVLDIGCGNEKVIPQSIGIDLSGKAADIRTNLVNPNALGMFSNNSVDVVFSSHMLEDCVDYQGTLKEMWRVIKPNGKLILYLPHKDYYPNIGQPGANLNHKHDFIPADILKAMDKFASYKLLRNESHNEDNEYSFELVMEKLDTNGVPIRYVATEKPKDNSVLLVRYGAVGDMLVMTPAIRLLKERGHSIYINTYPDCRTAIENNPYVDGWHLQQEDAIRIEFATDGTHGQESASYIEDLKKRYEKVIILHHTMERLMLFQPDQAEWNLSHEERENLCQKNYVDVVLERCGLPERGLLPEIYLHPMEEELGKYLRFKYSQNFVIQWQLMGSTWHKFYPYADLVIENLVRKYPDVVVFMSGYQPAVKVIEWGNHPRVKPRVGVWNMRQSLIFPKFVDLVISPETAVLHAAGAFGTPVIGLLTHSSRANITKYFKNDYSLQSSVPCSPCHKLISKLEECPRDEVIGFPICMSQGFPMKVVEDQIDKVYALWKEGRH